jgi:hypothetical protein
MIASLQKVPAASVGDGRWKKDCGRYTDSNQREKKKKDGQKSGATYSMP